MINPASKALPTRAAGHKSSRLAGHQVEPKFLPGYSPDFNPIERLSLRLKAARLRDVIARTPEPLTALLYPILKGFLTQPDKAAAISSIQT